MLLKTSIWANFYLVVLCQSLSKIIIVAHVYGSRERALKAVNVEVLFFCQLTNEVTATPFLENVSGKINMKKSSIHNILKKYFCSELIASEM